MCDVPQAIHNYTVYVMGIDDAVCSPLSHGALAQATTAPGEERTAAMNALLDNETKALQSIQKLKIAAQRDTHAEKTEEVCLKINDIRDGGAGAGVGGGEREDLGKSCSGCDRCVL